MTPLENNGTLDKKMAPFKWSCVNILNAYLVSLKNYD